MIYHIFNYGVYAKQFHSFIKRNEALSTIEQQFHCFNIPKNKKVESDIIPCDSFLSLLKLYCGLRNNDKVILHSYNHPWLYILCFIFRWKLKRFSWVIWGYDLYFYREYNSSFKFEIYEYLRRSTIPRFPYLLTDVEGDFSIACDVYKVKGVHLNVGYPVSGLLDNPGKVSDSPQGEVNILLGNSADPSNNHNELLDILEKMKSEKIRLYVPLSYGGDKDYIESIITKGYRVFGDKFIPLTEFLDYEEYSLLLKKIDVMFSIQNRQQAQGNIWVVLSNGGKVFLRPNVTTSRFLLDKNICLYPYYTPFLEDFSSMIFMPADCRIKNCSVLNAEFSEYVMMTKWIDCLKKI